MSDDLTKRGPADAGRINVHEPHELSYLSEKFGISADKLKELVAELGIMTTDVEKAVCSEARSDDK